MPLEAFKASQPLTLGVELELQLVDPYDRDLRASAGDLLELLGRKPFPGQVKPEITESMIEIATGIHARHDPMLAQLREMRDALLDAGDRLNIAICGGGTHPFQRWFEQRIFAAPRFKQLSGLYGYLAQQFTVFGQHVHVGCASADDALYLVHALARYVPHFIALAAASPYLQGVDTLFDSARLSSISAFPLSGRAPFVLSWQEFEQGYFAKMEATGVVKSMKDFYWDIRPKPEYGTVELRVCDTPLQVERAAALACYLQCLCQHLLGAGRIEPSDDDYLVYSYNRFQACRFGLGGVIVHPRTNEPTAIRDDVQATLRELEPHAGALECQPALNHLDAIAAAGGGGNDAAHLRTTYAASGTMAAVVAESVRIFRGSAPADERRA